jgi:hypothetical protein
MYDQIFLLFYNIVGQTLNMVEIRFQFRQWSDEVDFL